MLTASLWKADVVVLLVSASAISADGVDILGKCLISTEAPRNAEMMWSVLRRIEAVTSCGTLLFSQPNTRASLSVSKVTSLPTRMSGQHRNGRRRPTASNVDDLQTKA